MKKRYVVLFSFLGLFSLFLLIHYANLMINGEPPPPPRQRASLPERGSILDRNGRFLALSIRFADVSVWRPSIPRAGNSQNLPCLDIIAEELADILEMTPDEIRTRITASESNFLYLRRQIDDATARRLSALIRERRIRGIIVQPVSGRVYPEGNLASQVVGFVGNTNEGIEFAFDNILSGVNNDGIGSDVVLTIDVHVQYILHQIAERTKQETQAESIIFVAMDPRNGYILGSVSLPDFDPNNFRVSDANSRMNRPAIWAFEPGSTFKVYTMAALLDAGAIRHDSVFFCNGVFMPARGAPITCLVNHGRVTAREIVILSCNVGAAYASQNISPAAFHRSLSDLGFGSRTGAGSPGETAGYFAPVSSWSDRSKPTIAFGQEIAVSAYQILKATSAIANDGILVPPRLVSRIVSPDGRTSSEWESGPSRRVMSAETARAMRSYMADTARVGAMGWRAGMPDLSIGVKTGTAQMIDPLTGRYSDTDFIASCVALFPAENPSLVLYLAIVKPQGHIFGARIAAPVIREAAEAIVAYFGIPRGRNPLITHPSSIHVPMSSLPVLNAVVPDFTGAAKRILLPLLLRDDITVEIHGDGWVREQYPPAGTPVTEGMTLILALE